MVPSKDQVTEYFHFVEQYVVSTVSSASPDLPNVREALNRLWDDMSRFGPSLSEIKNKIPALGDFELPPPPPPPPKTLWYEQAANWANDHRWTVAGAGVGAVGAGLLVGYVSAHTSSRSHASKLKAAASSERRQVVVLLGGDHALAPLLIAELERKGYIVFVSVQSLEHGQDIERRGHGYVRAIALDPSDASTIPQFLRNLASSLSRRFPINASGDPHVSPVSQPYIHSVVSLLTLPDPSSPLASIAGPIEHLPSEAYRAYLQCTHLTPLQIVQSLLPLLRSSPARARDKAERSIVLCLSATDIHASAPFSGAAAVTAAANLKVADALRHEVIIAAAGPQGEGMKRLRVVTLEVGAVDSTAARRHSEGPSPSELFTTLEGWTNSEKSAYGDAFIASLEEGRRRQRTQLPSPVRVLAHKLLGIIDGGRTDTSSVFGYVLSRVALWMRRDRLVVGVGAGTYSLASGLPPWVLDILLNIPSLLIAVRNALITIQPFRRPRASAFSRMSAPSGPSTPAASTMNIRRQITAAAITDESSLSDAESIPQPETIRRKDVVSDVETGSEADVESNTEHDSGAEAPSQHDADHPTEANSMASSWVNLDS